MLGTSGLNEHNFIENIYYEIFERGISCWVASRCGYYALDSGAYFGLFTTTGSSVSYCSLFYDREFGGEGFRDDKNKITPIVLLSDDCKMELSEETNEDGINIWNIVTNN